MILFLDDVSEWFIQKHETKKCEQADRALDERMRFMCFNKKSNF